MLALMQENSFYCGVSTENVLSFMKAHGHTERDFCSIWGFHFFGISFIIWVSDVASGISILNYVFVVKYREFLL